MELWTTRQRRKRDESRGCFGAAVCATITIARMPGVGGAGDGSGGSSPQQLPLLDEYIGWAERAIAVSSRAANPNKRQQLELVAALAEAQIHSWGPGSRKVAETDCRPLPPSR